MQALWAPWRGDYVSNEVHQEPSHGCVFCVMQTQPDTAASLILCRTPHSFVVMNRFPYTNGHLLVLPLQHTGDLEQLADEVFADVNQTVRRMLKALRAAVKAEGFNVGLNLGKVAGAGIPGHMHYHIVPRWAGDTNFMPLLAETPVISQHLESTYQLIKAQL